MAKSSCRLVEGALESLAQAVSVGQIDPDSMVEWTSGMHAARTDLMDGHLLGSLMEENILTRRSFLHVSALTAAGYAMAAESILAQAIRTDAVGLVTDDVSIPAPSLACSARKTKTRHPRVCANSRPC
jgi:hypothetical protein